MLPLICVKSFIAMGLETTDPWGIENLKTTRIRRRRTFVAIGDPVSGSKSNRF